MSSFERLERSPGLSPTEICMELYAYATKVPEDQCIVEIGVYKARSLCYLAHGARHGGGAHVYGVDPWNLPGNIRTRHKFNNPTHRRAAQLTVRKQGMGKYVTLIRGFSTEEAARWTGPQIGLLHVDGDHSYDAVRGDVLAWATHLAPGAVIAFDDYSGSHNPGVAKAVDALVEEGVLKPITLLHDRLAVTSLISTAPVEQWLDQLDPRETPAVHLTDQDREELAQKLGVGTGQEESTEEPEFAPADDAIEALEDIVRQAEDERRDAAHEEAGEVEVTPVGPVEPRDFSEAHSEPPDAADVIEIPIAEPVNDPGDGTGEESAQEPNTSESPAPPPRAGAGSGRGPWIDYAVKVTSRPESHWATMSRAEIISELEQMRVI